MVTNLFVSPRVGEPFDDPRFKIARDAPEGHVLFDAVHFILKLNAGNVHVADHATDVAHDSREYENSGEEISHYEQIFQVVLRLRRLTCGPKSLKSRLVKLLN